MKKEEKKKHKNTLHDYSGLRLEFLQSSYSSHYEFFQQIHGKDLAKNGVMNKETSWRTSKKKEFLEEVNAEALKRAKEKLVKWVEFDAWKLKVMKANVMALFQDKIADARPKYERDSEWKVVRDENGLPKILKEWIYLDATELKTIMNVIKLELWEPLTVIRNENVDLTIDEEDLDEFGDEGLSDEEKEIAQDISWLEEKDK